MGRLDDTHRKPPDAQAGQAAVVSNHAEWTRELRSAVRCAGLLLGLLLLVDRAAGQITPWRAGLWFALAALLFVVLCPDRVSASGNRLAVRRLLGGHRVRTDLLVSVRCLDGVSQRLVLRDSLGGRVEIDPEVLVRHPQLWFRLDEGARKAAADGLLLCGQTALRRLSVRVERETARAVFTLSRLE
ncbi:hypothetical protein ACWEKM_36490 [Streptomyces sp. NPDC004752]